MSIIKRIKLFKTIMKFASVVTEEAELIYENELMEGTEVFIESEDGEIIPAPDNTYHAEGRDIIVEEGKVKEIVEKSETTTEEVVVEAAEDETSAETAEPEDSDEVKELKAKIAELENMIAEKDQYIAELEAKMETKEEELKSVRKKSVNQPIKPQEVKNSKGFTADDVKDNPALKYFM